MRRIVVTGMGAVSPLGCGVETNWSRLLAGRSGIRTLPEAITADLSAKVGGQVPDVAVDPEGGFDPDRSRLRDPQRRLGPGRRPLRSGRPLSPRAGCECRTAPRAGATNWSQRRSLAATPLPSPSRLFGASIQSRSVRQGA